MVAVEEAVEQHRDGGGATEQLSLVLDGAIEGEHYVGPFVTAHDELEYALGGVWQLAHAEGVDDEQRHAGRTRIRPGRFRRRLLSASRRFKTTPGRPARRWIWQT